MALQSAATMETESRQGSGQSYPKRINGPNHINLPAGRIVLPAGRAILPAEADLLIAIDQV